MSDRTGIMLSDAWFIAERQHRNKTDLRGRPYMFHLIEVAADVTEHGPEAVIVAVLHDYYEDGGQGDLGDFAPAIRAAVDAITRMDGETYAEYIDRVGHNHIATVVKLADLRRNLATCPRDSLLSRYRSAINALEAVASRRYFQQGAPA